jgi:ATP-dependent RNA helicase RhlE
MTFNTLGLSKPLLKAVSEQGYTHPTPIQKAAIAPVIEGRDILAAAQTGTGKTAGFTLPLLERLTQKQPHMKKYQIRALILVPTRELAAQVAESFRNYGRHMPYRTTVIFGGVGINPQLATIRKGVDIVIATPGRLLDIAAKEGIDLSVLETLVLDEADRMLDMGFIHDIKKLMRLMPKKRQTLLFSATFSNDIKKLAHTLLNDPVMIEVARENTTAEQIEHRVHYVEKSAKKALLSKLVKTEKWEQVLVFTRTKHGANRLTKQLQEEGISAAAIHGNKSQGARTKALASFKSNEIRVLVATDIAARGLDISNLPHVVNYELPNVAEDYVHRIGRTGRAGKSGEAISLVSREERELLENIEKFIGTEIRKENMPSAAVAEKEEEHKVPQKRKRERKKSSKEALAAEIGSKMLEKLEKYDTPKPKNRNNRRRG